MIQIYKKYLTFQNYNINKSLNRVVLLKKFSCVKRELAFPPLPVCPMAYWLEGLLLNTSNKVKPKDPRVYGP